MKRISLKEYFTVIGLERDRTVDRRFDHVREDIQSLKGYVNALRQSDKEYLGSLAAEREKAIEKYEVGAKQWRDQANEWRMAMQDREARFVGNGAFDALKEQVTDLTKRYERSDGKGEGVDKGHTDYRLVIAIVIAAMGVVFGIMEKFGK